MSNPELFQSLPDIEALRKTCQGLAVLDAILGGGDGYYSFNATWGEGEQVAQMSDGSGDEWFGVFSSHGAVLLGLEHESPMYKVDSPQPHLYEKLPREMADVILEEPAFDSKNKTFCLWREAGAAGWDHGIPDEAVDQQSGTLELLGVFSDTAKRYQKFAEDYYEIDVSTEDVEAVLRHEVITQELIDRLGGEVDLEDLAAELVQIGYRLEPGDSVR